MSLNNKENNKDIQKSHPIKINERKYFFLLLLILILIGFWFRVESSHSKSIWYDEAFSLAIVNQKSLSDVIKTCKNAIHPPLYHVLIYLFYNPENNQKYNFFNLRLISIFFGLLTIPISFFIGQKLKDNWTGIIMASLMMISPFAVHYSQELRMYSLLSFMTSLQLLISLYWIDKRKIYLGVLLSFLSVLAILTQYYAIFSTFGIFLFLTYISFNKKNLKGILNFIYIPLLTFILFLTWLNIFIQHGRMNVLSGTFSAGNNLTISFIRTCFIDILLGIIPSGLSLFFKNISPLINSLEITIFVLFISILFILGIFKIQKYSSYNKTNEFFFLVFTLIFPLILTFIHIILKGRFYSRYLIVYLPIIFFWLSVGIRFYKNLILRVIFLIIVAFFFLSSTIMINRIDLRDVTLTSSKFLINEILKSKKYPINNPYIIHTSPWSFLPFKQYLSHDYQQLIYESSKINQVDRVVINKTEIIKDTSKLENKDIILVISEWNYNRKSEIGDEFQRKHLDKYRCILQKDFIMGIKWIQIKIFTIIN